MLCNPIQAVQAKHAPQISVSSSGLITATCSGTSTTKQLATQGAATVTPGASAKTAVTSGRYTTGAVTVAGDANLVAGNIKSGVSIFGVNGTFTGVSTAPSSMWVGNSQGSSKPSSTSRMVISNMDMTYEQWNWLVGIYIYGNTANSRKLSSLLVLPGSITASATTCHALYSKCLNGGISYASDFEEGATVSRSSDTFTISLSSLLTRQSTFDTSITYHCNPIYMAKS